jgi:hypothetical protein
LGALVVLALAVVLVVTSIVTVKVVRQKKTKAGKLLASIGLPLIVILVVFGDELAAVTYMHVLCKTEGGPRVYKTVELPTSYFKEASQEYWSGYMPDEKQLKSRFDFRSEERAHPLGLMSRRFAIIDRTNGETLGASVTVSVSCGWFQSMFGIQCGYRCPTGPSIDQLYKQVFRHSLSTN